MAAMGVVRGALRDRTISSFLSLPSVLEYPLRLSLSSFFSYVSSFAILHRSGKDPPRVALHESVVDKESVKLALRQHYPAGYRCLGCLVISSRVRPTVLLATRAPQRKLIALRATVPSSGTGPSPPPPPPSTRSCPTAASPVLTRGYSPCDPIRRMSLCALPLVAVLFRDLTTLRASSTRNEGRIPSATRILLFHSLCSFVETLSPLHAPTHTHTHIHTRTWAHARARARAYTHVYIYIRSDAGDRARARQRSVLLAPLTRIHP